ncbi:hypothetical protein P9869_34990 [Streptomyces ossamyceticus]|nr:hypothetical protein [Streptomyces ossamyceticus]
MPATSAKRLRSGLGPSLMMFALTVTMAGCDAAGSEQNAGESATSRVPHLTTANKKGMPLDDYLLNPSQFEDVKSAYSQSIAKCVRSYGMTFETPNPSATPSALPDSPTTRIDGRFGFQSMTYAKKWGYHPPGGISKNKEKATKNTDADPDKWFALTGSRNIKEMSGPGGVLRNGKRVPSHGCVGSAVMQLTGSRDGQIGDADISTDLKFETLIKARNDPRTLRVFSLWSDCMREIGYSYGGPLDASSDPRWTESEKPTKEEIEIAVADQKCRKRHNVVGIWFAVDSEYQERAVTDNRAALSEAKKQLDRQVNAARKILLTH